jgi:hypothetical protein
MKIYTSKYRNHWVSPYTIADKLCFWREIDYDEPWVKRFNKLVGPVCEAWQWFLDKIHPRIVYIKIDRWDIWSLDHTLADIILPSLKLLQKVKHGSPMVDDEDVPVHLQSEAYKRRKKKLKDRGFNTNELHSIDNEDSTLHERWDWVLNEMIWAFEQKTIDDADGQFFDHSESTGLPWDSDYQGPKYDKAGHDAWQARMQNGFRLFGKYYSALWD